MTEEEHNPEGLTEEEVWQALEEAVGVIKIDLLLDLSEFAVRRKDDTAALTLAEQAVEEANEADDATWKARALEVLGRRLYRVDRYAESAEAHVAAARLFEQYDNHRDAAFSYSHASWAFELNEDYEEALTQINAAISFGAVLDPVPGAFFMQRADVLEGISDESGEVLQALADARQSFRQSGETNSVLSVDDRVADLFTRDGEYESACNLLRDCLSVAESLSQEQTAYFSYRYGMALNRNGDYDEALETLKRSLEINLQSDQLRQIAAVYQEYARSYDGLGDLDSALQYLAKARAHYDIAGLDRAVRECEGTRSVLLHRQGRYDEAALVNQMLIETGDAATVFDAYARLSDNLRSKGDFEAALKAARPGFEIDEPFVGTPMWFWREAVLALTLKELGRLGEAYEIARERLGSNLEGAGGWVRAVFHELRGDEKLEADEEAAHADWARAVALYLSAGHPRAARVLSAAFLPAAAEEEIPQ